MGDLSSSDCSWKKMVIAKANNEWISTIRTECNKMDNTEIDKDTNSEHEEVPLQNVKQEQEENCDENYQTEMAISITQDIDPLALLQERSDLADCDSSGGANYENSERTRPRRRRHRLTEAPKRESSESRATRLAKMSAYAAQRLANESSEQRATRLRRMSEYAAKRLAHETSEQRAKRLSRMSAYAARRLANETPEQRRARLARMSAYAARRRVTGSNSSAEFSNESQV